MGSIAQIASPRAFLTSFAEKRLYTSAPISELDFKNCFEKLHQDFPVQEKIIKPSDDVKIRTWFVKQQDPNAKTRVFFHGTGSDIIDQVKNLREAYRDGYNACIFSYRSFPGNNGMASEQGIIDDAKAVLLDLIDSRNIKPGSIELIAKSFGGAVAVSALAQLAENRSDIKFDTLVLLSTFSSMQKVMQHNIARVLGKPIAKLLAGFIDASKWNSKKTLGKLTNVKKIIFLHGDRDKLVPVQDSEELYQQASARGLNAKFITAEGYGHNGVPWKSLIKNSQ